MSHRLKVKHGDRLELSSSPRIAHIFDESSIDAVNAALGARRPLLVRGEPGTGKSQLARAAARALQRAFVSEVIDARTEARDLLYTFDAVRRLARAQVLGALGKRDPDQIEEELRERHFVRPGVLWRAFNLQSACALERRDPPGGWKPADGTVVLIDEIDKADSDVPNGLLEALGNGEFHPLGFDEPIRMDAATPPLVFVTTNEERALPDAFLRRCLVLRLELPGKRAALIERLVERGGAHFEALSPAVLTLAAERLAEHRDAVRAQDLAPPGQAEYLDLLRAVSAIEPSAEAKQLALIRKLEQYTFRKHPDSPAS